MCESGADGQAEGGGLSATSRGGEGDCGREGLFGNGLDEGEDGFCLMQ